jgi:hypothetical protein
MLYSVCKDGNYLTIITILEEAGKRFFTGKRLV